MEVREREKWKIKEIKKKMKDQARRSTQTNFRKETMGGWGRH